MRSVSRRASCAIFSGSFAVLDLLENVERFFLARVCFAKLGLDRAQLLAEIELALVLLDLDLGLLLHVLHHARPRDFALEPREDEAQPLSDVEALQHLVLVGDPEVHVRRREVGEPARIGDVHLEDRRNFVRNAIHELGQRLGGRDDARHEVVDVALVGRRFARRANRRDRVGFRLLHSVDHDAPQSLQRDLHRVARQIDPLVDACRDANASEESVRVDRLVVVAARDDEGHDQSGLFVRPEQREVFRCAHLHRDRSERINDR